MDHTEHIQKKQTDHSQMRHSKMDHHDHDANPMGMTGHDHDCNIFANDPELLWL
jgi:hypothetical protein